MKRRGLVIGFRIVAGPGGDPVAEVRWPSPNWAENARLIAAAPELLQALEGLLGAASSPAAERRDLLRRARNISRAARGNDVPECEE